MKKIIFLILLSIYHLTANAQTTSKFNLGLEERTQEEKLSKGWTVMADGDYTASTDSLIKNSGRYSGKITSQKAGTEAILVYEIPALYGNPKTLHLEGFIKTKNIENGKAGLFLATSSKRGFLAMNSMEKNPITETADWKKYSIQLDYPKDSYKIVVGMYVAGVGEFWVDDLTLKIDGEDVQIAKTKEKVIAKAETDTAFDNGSTITETDLQKLPVADLELLGKVWGFLKVYHPAIASGNLNWDYELFRFLQKYTKTQTKSARETLLSNWIASLGEVAPCTTCKPTDENAKVKPDFSWIEEIVTLKKLQTQLYHIYKNRHQGAHYYLTPNPIGFPEFKKEKAYANMPYPDAGFRLLALYKEWNTIHYFFPYKYLMDKDWNTILKAYIPKFINAKDELAYEMAVIELSGDIQDTHANLWRGRDQFTKYLGTKRAAAQVTFVEGNLVVVAYFNEALAAASGLQKGDVITEIDGKSVVALINDTKKFYPASNRPTVLRDFAKSALKANTETLQLTIRRNQIEKTISTQLYTSKELDMKAWYAQKLAKKSYKILEGNIGYINLEVLKKQEIPAMKTALKNTQGIVVDIRNYPREFVVHALASFFTTTTKPFVKFTMCNSQNIGAFLWSNSFDVKASADAYPRKLVVLVNEITQSQAEFTAMALRATDNATIIGSQTAGADGNITELKLPGGLEIYFTAIGIYYPDGTDTQRIGIVPDIEVQPTIQGIRDGKDELLAKAIEIIQEAKK